MVARRKAKGRNNYSVVPLETGGKPMRTNELGGSSLKAIISSVVCKRVPRGNLGKWKKGWKLTFPPFRSVPFRSARVPPLWTIEREISSSTFPSLLSGGGKRTRYERSAA